MKFRVNCSFGSGEKVQNRFSTGLPGRPSWISDLVILVTFDLQVILILPVVLSQWSFCSGEEIQNKFSR